MMSSMKGLLWGLIAFLVVFTSDGGAINQEVRQFLQKESSALSTSQGQVIGFLKSKGIRIGTKASERMEPVSDVQSDRVRIAMSTDTNNLECRVALGRAPTGSKVVAPCRCSGSQEWVQFSELNRLRRRDPKQWTVCPTCQTKFDFRLVQDYGGVQGNVVTALLDKPVVVRGALSAIAAMVSVFVRMDLLVLRLLTCRPFWNMYHNWSKLVRLPLVLKYWGGKVVLGYAFLGYLKVEKMLLGHLTEIETAIVEPNLPVENVEEAEAMMAAMMAQRDANDLLAEEEEEEEYDDDEDDEDDSDWEDEEDGDDWNDDDDDDGDDDDDDDDDDDYDDDEDYEDYDDDDEN